ncbi:hypothetical protein NW768_011355 [Fusarium equiseti]|uniref:Uncharacterized protein n=1 Tax=Fusarium equiseti TaxID=61235 RepID=A0ABQ8QXV9_FUSEQ|nr:hypothetical protein NW768_011355 [Fusarium equiseti]
MAPGKTRNEKAAVAATQTLGDDSMSKSKDQLALTKWHHKFISVKRIYDKDNQHPSMEYSRAAKKYQDFKYPKGVLINFQYKATVGANAELAPYLAFRGVLETNSYIEIIVPDIVHQAALVAFNNFEIEKDIVNFESTMI